MSRSLQAPSTPSPSNRPVLSRGTVRAGDISGNRRAAAAVTSGMTNKAPSGLLAATPRRGSGPDVLCRPRLLRPFGGTALRARVDEHRPRCPPRWTPVAAGSAATPTRCGTPPATPRRRRRRDDLRLRGGHGPRPTPGARAGVPRRRHRQGIAVLPPATSSLPRSDRGRACGPAAPTTTPPSPTISGTATTSGASASPSRTSTCPSATSSPSSTRPAGRSSAPRSEPPTRRSAPAPTAGPSSSAT